MARNARARIVILFLDVPHVTMGGSWQIREPLIRLLDRTLGPDDLVGVMTPSMAPTDVVLSRKTDVIAGGLRREWPWGERFTLEKNKTELEYEACYPPTRAETQVGKTVSDMAREMTDRRRERATLDALDELVLYLRDLRDERKAIVTVSEGWLLFRTNQALTKIRIIDPTTGEQDPIPGVDPISVGPDGRITTRNTKNATGNDYSLMQCAADRMKLAYLDNWVYFRQIMDDANRANATFYTVDPRGLAVFDTPIGPDAPPPVTVDANLLRGRLDTLRILANNTDGIAVIGNNDLDAGMKRIADDLTSYYLLGYYSTNAKQDGKFHAIKVRVKRPGVEVRARRGYRSATAEEIARSKTAAAAPVPESVSTIAAAIGALSRIRPEARLHINAVPQTAAGSRAIAHVWVAGELAGVSDASASGTTAEVEVKTQSTSDTTTVTLVPGQRGFLTDVTLAKPVEATAIDVRVRLTGATPGGDRASDSITAELSPGLPRPLLFRRGPSTGNRPQPAASFLFSRTERVRLEIPIAAAWTPGTARLLGKTGQPLAIPVTTGERTDNRGQRWLTADVTLAPLAPGDYAIELSATTPDGEQRVVTAIRVVR